MSNLFLSKNTQLGTAMSLLFADYWNHDLHRPSNILRPDQVDTRLETGSQFITIVGGWDGNEGSPPDFIMEFHPNTRGRPTRAVIRRFYPSGSVSSSTEFYEIDGKLFMRKAYDYSYASSKEQYRRADAASMITSRYKPDGSVQVEIDDTSSPMLDIREYRDVDVSQHWEEIPKTSEDFERLGRLETFLADKE